MTLTFEEIVEREARSFGKEIAPLQRWETDVAGQSMRVLVYETQTSYLPSMGNRTQVSTRVAVYGHEGHVMGGILDTRWEET
jgi:hypothetical protein